MFRLSRHFFPPMRSASTILEEHLKAVRCRPQNPPLPPPPPNAREQWSKQKLSPRCPAIYCTRLVYPDTLATKTTKPKPDPPAPNFMFYPATKAMPGGARSVPAEPMITLLRLLRSITDSLKAVVKKDKVMHVLCCKAVAAADAVLQTMQQEIQRQGAELATLKANR